jgi:hypothetical protein
MAEYRRDALQRSEGRISLAPLNAPDVSDVKAACVSKLLLGHITL